MKKGREKLITVPEKFSILRIVSSKFSILLKCQIIIPHFLEVFTVQLNDREQNYGNMIHIIVIVSCIDVSPGYMPNLLSQNLLCENLVGQNLLNYFYAKTHQPN